MGSLTITVDVLLEVLDFREGRVLAASAEKIAQALESDTAVTALVKQGKSLLVVGRSLRFKCVRIHDLSYAD